MKELLIMAKSLGGGGSEVALIELINALPEELYNITLVLLDSDNEYAYRLKKNVNIVQLTFNSSFAKSLVSMYAFPAKVLKKLSVNSFIAYYDFISNCVTNVFEKTYDIAIKAASILKKRKINFAWYAIGGGRDEKKLKKLVEKYCLENQFVFLGRKKNPYPYMKHCDLYVQPSRHEGYVITLVEARALCLPILSSDIPSAREQIQDGINGYIAELSAEDLADKIEYLYNNPSQRKKTVEYLKEHPIDFSTELLKLNT